MQMIGLYIDREKRHNCHSLGSIKNLLIGDLGYERSNSHILYQPSATDIF